MSLTLNPNLSDPDGFYAALIDVHKTLSQDQSTDYNARLILILANHIGDKEVLQQALSAARTPLNEKV